MGEYRFDVNLVKIYECLCDGTRLRILNLLLEGPLCVCHLQAVLGESQVKISKHLSYLKTRGMVEAGKMGNWRVYRLAARRPAELEANLRCLQDCAREDAVFRRDLAKLKKRRGCFANEARFPAKTRAVAVCAC